MKNIEELLKDVNVEELLDYIEECENELGENDEN